MIQRRLLEHRYDFQSRKRFNIKPDGRPINHDQNFARAKFTAVTYGLGDLEKQPRSEIMASAGLQFDAAWWVHRTVGRV